MNKTIRLNIYNLFFYTVIFYLISEFLYSYINAFFPITRLLGVTVLASSCYMLLGHLRRKEVVLIFLVFLVFIMSFICASDFSTNLNDAVYWLSTMMMLVAVTKEKVLSKLSLSFENEISRIKWLVILTDIILVFCLLNASCYSASWGGRYFVAFAPSNHVCISSACLLLSLTVACSSHIKNDIGKIIMMLPGTIAVLQGGARTYLVSLVIIWIMFYFYRIEHKSFKILALPIVLCGAWYLFANTGLINKFINPNTYVTAVVGMEKLTGGRSAFWAIDFEKYLELNSFYLVFGKGFDFPYFVNQTYYNGMRIWCHNDFLDCLLSGGLLCFLVYMYIVFENIFSLKDSKILMAFLGLYYLFVAFINGLFGYQHYLLSYIMLYIFVRCDFNKQEGKQ